jgi:hypothetical protein
VSGALFIAQRAVTVRSNSVDEATVAGIVVGAVVLAIIVMVVIERRRSRALRVREVEAVEQQQRQHITQLQRDEKAFGQHVSLNDLTARKLELEAQLMQLQLAAATNEQLVREQNDEYHKLMVQKAQLEIQSLRLHIREQLKRNEDFSGYDEE